MATTDFGATYTALRTILEEESAGQGKSCFNFTKVDPALFAERRALTRRCREACADGTIEIAVVKRSVARKTAAAPKRATSKKRA